MAQRDYVREFPIVEVQQTFYEPPQDAVMQRWRRQAPPGFEFTLKAWQVITHDGSSPTYRRMRHGPGVGTPEEYGSFRTTAAALAAWQRTVECVRMLRASAVVFQCPRSFRPSPENAARMREFFATIGRLEGVRFLWEPRGEWPPELVLELCTELELVHVVDPFVSQTATPEQIYFRLHGITGSRHVYSDEELEQLAAMVSGTRPYVMFNNIPRVGDAQRFKQIMRGASAGGG